MLVYLPSKIPLKSELLNESLREFSSFVKRFLVPSDGAEIAIALTESGARTNSSLAQSLPAATKAFGLNWNPLANPLTVEEFLREVDRQKPKKTGSQLRLNVTSISNIERLLQKLANLVPSSGRGITLLLSLTDWRIVGNEFGPAVDASFSRFRHRASTLGASLTLRFQALSLKDPVVAAASRAVSQKLGLQFGKPMAAFANAAVFPSVAAPVLNPEVQLQLPSPKEQVIVLQTFDEALARAAEQIGAQPEDLNSIPLLSSRFESAKKRMDDVAAGKKEKIDLTWWLKQFMKERLPEYRFDTADAEQVWFRKVCTQTSIYC